MESRKPNSKYEGMTTGESLSEAGLLEQFEQARLGRDREKMISLLRQVDFTEEGAKWCVNLLLRDSDSAPARNAKQ